MLGRAVCKGDIGSRCLPAIIVMIVVVITAMILVGVFSQYRNEAHEKATIHMRLPSFHHVVIVVKENRPFDEIIGSSLAPDLPPIPVPLAMRV